MSVNFILGQTVEGVLTAMDILSTAVWLSVYTASISLLDLSPEVVIATVDLVSLEGGMLYSTGLYVSYLDAEGYDVELYVPVEVTVFGVPASPTIDSHSLDASQVYYTPLVHVLVHVPVWVIYSIQSSS